MASLSSKGYKHEEYSSHIIRNLQPSRPISPLHGQFDSNLDYILEDLQQSISRPSSSMGQPIISHQARNEIQCLYPANTTSEMRERSLGTSVHSNRIFKTSKYESSTATSDSMNEKIRDTSELNKLDTLLSDLEKERTTATFNRSSRNNLNNIIGINDPNLCNRSLTRTPVFREPNYDDAMEKSSRHISPEIEIQKIVGTAMTQNHASNFNDENLYGKPRVVDYPLSPMKNEKHVQKSCFSNETIRVNEKNEIESSNVLEKVPLPHEYLPKPGTKVITTVRTYTYEIPEKDEPSYPDSQTNNAVFYKSERRERSGGFYPETSTPTKPLRIREQPLTDIVPINDQPEIRRLTSSEATASPPSTSYHWETTKRHYHSTPQPNLNSVYANQNHGLSSLVQDYPQKPQPHILRQTTTFTSRNVNHSVDSDSVLRPFPVEGPVSEIDGNPPKRVEDLMASFGDTSAIHYTNKRVTIDNKLENTPKVYTPSSEFEKEKKLVSSSKNITGPPVYYPPNHELFAAKEESSLCREHGGGKYARASGKYMYESSSKSKSSSKSGAAVVPLCCPLCCAMPCSIM